MFADDTQLINKTEESIEETFKTLEIYEKASGNGCRQWLRLQNV
jgi:hypothetical protein